MRRKPRWAAVGPVGDLAAELRKQLDRCRVDRAERKKMVALLHLCGDCNVDQTILQSQLVEALTKFCPPHAVFGQNDGGDWGFWAVVDDNIPALWVSDMRHAGSDIYLLSGQGLMCGRIDLRGRFQPYWDIFDQRTRV